MACEIRIAPAAERAIGKLSAQIQVLVLDKLEELAEDPRPVVCEKVRELAQYGVFRVKVGKGLSRLVPGEGRCRLGSRG